MAPRLINNTLVQSDVMVPMRDGVHLATDIYFPAQEGQAVPGRFPVTLERTPYGKHLPSRSERSLVAPGRDKSRAVVAALFGQQGFVVIYQDCRGRYNSEGTSPISTSTRRLGNPPARTAKPSRHATRSCGCDPKLNFTDPG